MTRCKPCRTEFELQALAKRVVTTACARTPAPSHLANRIRLQIRDVVPLQEETRRHWRIFDRKKFVPALAVAIVAVIVLVLFTSLPLSTRHLHTSPKDNNIIHQTLNNFDAVLGGSMPTVFVATDHESLRQELERNANVSFNVPQLRDCSLEGGMLSDCSGQPAAHVVYKRGNDVIYLYQVDLKAALRGEEFDLPADVKEELLRTGWYILAGHPKCTLALWISGEKLCAIIADIGKDELLEVLAYAE